MKLIEKILQKFGYVKAINPAIQMVNPPTEKLEYSEVVTTQLFDRSQYTRNKELMLNNMRIAMAKELDQWVTVTEEEVYGGIQVSIKLHVGKRSEVWE